jgi:hypothetical protein
LAAIYCNNFDGCYDDRRMNGRTEQNIVLAVGETTRLALPGRGSAGFSWAIDCQGDIDAIEIKRTAGERPELPPAGGLPPPSFSLDEVLVITALREGTVTLDADLRRHTEPPVETRRILIKVTAGSSAR